MTEGILNETAESDRYYRIRRELEDELRAVLQKSLAEEFEKYFWKAKAMGYVVGAALIVLGIGTWHELPRIAGEAVNKAVNADVISAASEIMGKKEYVVDLVKDLEDEQNKLILKVSKEIKGDTNFIKSVKGDRGEKGVKGDRGDDADNTKIIESLKVNPAFQKNIVDSVTDGLKGNSDFHELVRGKSPESADVVKVLKADKEFKDHIVNDLKGDGDFLQKVRDTPPSQKGLRAEANSASEKIGPD
jgi:hypothetical protein